MTENKRQGRIGHEVMMATSSIRQIVLLLVLLLFSSLTFSCATIMNGTSQDVGFASYPSGAKVTVDGDSLGVTPLTVGLARRHPHTVMIEAVGYPPFDTIIMRKFSRWTLMLPFHAPIDYLSGGIFKLEPVRLQVRLYDGIIVQEFDSTIWNIPPLNRGRITAEILGGVAAGTALAYGLLSTEPNKDKEDLLGAGFAIITGLTIGSMLGVYLVGNLGNETGSFDKTVQGSFSGLLGSLVLLPLFQGSDYGLIIMAISQSIAATIGFNMNRRYKTPSVEAETGLINISDGKLSLAAPLMYMRPNPFISGDWVPTIDLLRVKF